MNWTQEQRDELVRLWDNGRRSYSEIAEIMGIRKNQVVGRMRREKRIRGIAVEDRYSHSPQFARPKKVNTLIPIKRAKRMQEVLPEFVLDESRLASIIDVTGCKWPVKDDPDRIGGIACCNMDTDGSAYCEFHKRMNVASYSSSLIRKTTRAALAAYKRRAA